MHHHLGFVQNGDWHFLSPEREGAPTRRLTQLNVGAAQSPEAGEFDMSEYEGCLVLIEGHDNGQWIWSAQVVDQCDALMSQTVLLLLKTPSTQAKGEAALQLAHDALNRELAPLMVRGSGLSHHEEQTLAALRRALELVSEATDALEKAPRALAI